MAGPALQCVDLARHDGRFTEGLVSVRNLKATRRLDEKAAVRDAAALQHIDYIFFRRFKDDRSSQIAAYVVGNSQERLNNSQLARLHQQVWLQGATPLLYVAWPTRVDILSCARGPDFWNDETEEYQYAPCDRVDNDLKVAANISAAMQEYRHRYSALRLADGTFWDDPENAPLADHDRTAHRLLIQAIVETDKAIKGNKKPVLRRLNVRARSDFPMAHFHHEEHQPTRRRTDMSASPTEPIVIEGKMYKIYDPFLVIEGKRLPAPSSDREREYVTGFARRSGGIQRFKLGLHGGAHGSAVMVGYVQAESAQHWWTRINTWITELAECTAADGCNWKSSEILVDRREESAMKTARARSRHGRNTGGGEDDILLIHLWVAM